MVSLAKPISLFQHPVQLVRYTYDAGSFYAGLRLTNSGKVIPSLSASSCCTVDNNVGISAAVGAKLGGAALQLVGGYDVDREEGAVRLIATADLGPGTSACWRLGFRRQTPTTLCLSGLLLLNTRSRQPTS